MVRDMMHTEAEQSRLEELLAGGVKTKKLPLMEGQVVRSGNGAATTYVGATHCMAILEDVSYTSALGAMGVVYGELIFCRLRI